MGKSGPKINNNNTPKFHPFRPNLTWNLSSPKGTQMSLFERDFVNILKDPYKHPTINVFPLSTAVNNSNWFNIFNAASRAIEIVTGVNWKKLYPLFTDKGFHDKKRFAKSFDESLSNDAIIQDQIKKIIKVELESNILDYGHIHQRQAQLLDWLKKYYWNQLFAISNISETTLQSYKLELKLAYLTFSRILNTIFKDGIWLHIDSFHKCYKFIQSNKDKNLLLLPNHKSHVDYIIIHYLFVRFELETPIVIAGDNLNVPIFGKILKHLGALFIKRTFQKDLDFWYSQNLQNLLKFKMNHKPLIMELFIEGTRSRNGKLMHGKSGFLKSILQEIKDDGSNSIASNRETLAIPISIVYEKPLEFDDYLTELNGLDKKQESFTSILSNGVKFMQNDPRINFGKIYVRFDDEFLKFDQYEDKDEFCEAVLSRIHDIGFVSEISILGMTLLINFYKLNQQRKFKLEEVIPIFKYLLTKIVSKTIYDDHLLSYLDYGDTELIELFKHYIEKFLFDYIKLHEENIIEIIEETALVNYKNSLLHFFIPEMFMLQSKNNLKTLDIITKIFGYEFLTNNIDYQQTELDSETREHLQHLLIPFIESYELSFNHLIGVISITFKNWVHLIYMSRPHVQYKESLNKSNLIYAINILKRLKIIRTNKSYEVFVIDETKLELLRNYLYDLRMGNPLENQDEVFKLFNNIKL